MLSAHFPQAAQAFRTASAASAGSGMPRRDGVPANRSSARVTRFLHRAMALGVDFRVSTTDASARVAADASDLCGVGKSITTPELCAASARSPKTRLKLIGMDRTPLGCDSDMPSANGQGILNGLFSSSAKACTTAMASVVSAASREPGSKVANSARAASIWHSSDIAYASRSLRSSRSVYAPTTMPRAIFAATGTRGGFELFMVRVYGAGSMSLNGAKVAVTLRQPVQTVSGRYAVPALGFAA